MLTKLSEQEQIINTSKQDICKLSRVMAYLPAVDQVPYIEPHEVCEKFLVVNSSKTCGPDNIHRSPFEGICAPFR